MVGELDGDPNRAALHGVLFLDEAQGRARTPVASLRLGGHLVTGSVVQTITV